MADNTDFTGVLNMSALGDKLKEAREKKSLTIGQANKQTHIHPTVLKALEDGNCENILNHTYVKSFLKKYSDYLGLDTGRVIREYMGLRPDAGREIASKLPESKAALKSAPNVLPAVRLLATGIMVIAVVLFVGGKISSYLKKPAAPARVAGSKNNRLVSARSSKRVLRENAGFAKKVAETPVPRNVPLNLRLKVNRDVFVKVKTDGNLIFQRLLTKGTTEAVTADSVINIFVANGESVELVLNDKPLASLGNGPQKDVEITRSGVKLK